MSRTAVQNQQLQSFYGHQGGHTPTMKQLPGRGGTGERGDGGSKPPSRLLQMRDDYQKKLVKEKEDRLVRVYEENSRRNLERAERMSRPGPTLAYPNSRLRPPGYNQPPPQQNGATSVRDFFRERREMEARGGYVPPINHHYKQAKSRTGSGSSYLGSKHSAGVDRAQPLAPIQPRINGVSSAPSQQQSPFHNKPRLVKRSSLAGSSPTTDENDNHVTKPGNNVRNAGVGPNPRPPPPQLRGPANPPNADRGVRRAGSQGPEEEKMSDFQQWQMEQSRSREDRLKKLNQRAPPTDREGYEYEEEEEEEDEGVLRQQRELMEKINQEQAELERIRKEREADEEQERLEAEQLKKQQAADRERRKRQQQEEARQRREEESRIRKEEEEERKAVRRGRPEKQRKDDHYDDDDEGDAPGQPPAAQQSPHQPTPRGSSQRPKPENPAPKQGQAPQRKAQPPSRRQQQEEEEDDVTPVPGPGLDLYATVKDDGPNGKVRLVPCKLCERNFAEDRIAKHTEACKIAHKKRKTFDPTKMRTEGTEMAKYVSKGMHKKDPPKTKKKADWRRQHEEFINNIRYAKKVTYMEEQGMDTRDLTPPPVSRNPDLVPCPHCGRTFNISAAERHIPRCKDLKTKPATKKR